MAERKDPPGTPDDDASPYLPARSAYLLTLYHPTEGKGASFVTVQASHSHESHRFADLASAFSYLVTVTEAERSKGKKSGE